MRIRSRGSVGRAGSNGLLPLPFVPILVGRPGQCLHACGSPAPYGSRRVPNMLPCSKRPNSVNARYCRKCGGHLMANHPPLGLVDVFAATLPMLTVQPRRPRELCRNRFADAGWTSQAEGFSQRVWRLRRSRAGVRRTLTMATMRASAAKSTRSARGRAWAAPQPALAAARAAAARAWAALVRVLPDGAAFGAAPGGLAGAAAGVPAYCGVLRDRRRIRIALAHIAQERFERVDAGDLLGDVLEFRPLRADRRTHHVEGAAVRGARHLRGISLAEPRQARSARRRANSRSPRAGCRTARSR